MTFAASLQAIQIEISWALTVLVASSALYALIAQLVTACLAWWMQTAVQYRLDVKSILGKCIDSHLDAQAKFGLLGEAKRSCVGQHL